MDRRLRPLASLLLVVLGACGPAEPPRQDALPTPTTAAPTITPSPPDTSPPPDTVRFAAVGDIGDGSDVQRRVGERIAALHASEPIDALLLLGDMVYPDGAGHRYETNFAEPWRPVLEAGIPMLAALGNHDVQTRDGADMMERFEMSSRYYAHRLGPVTLFALDTNRFDGEQLEWLRSELASSETPWNIPFMHAPAYSSGHHGSTGYVQRGLDPIAREYEIALVIAGHDHDYERTQPIGGTTYVVAGTGCCLRPVERSDFTAVSFSEPGVVLVEADEERLVLEFVHADGRVLDSVELDRSEVVSPAA